MEKPIRILHVLTKLSFGGVQSVIMNYYRNIDRNKIQFDFVVQTQESSFYDEEVSKLGGKIYRVFPLHINRKKFEDELTIILKKNDSYKIIHVHQNFLNISALRIAKKNKIPIRISHSHSNYPASNFIVKLKRGLFRRLIRNYATEYFACSKEAAQWLYGKEKKGKKQFKIINNAISIEKFLFNKDIRNKLRKRFNIEKSMVLIHVGMFNDVKNHEYLIKIFKKINDERKDSYLFLIGDGQKKSELMKLCDNLNISTNVIFLGQVENVNEYLMAADFFIFPSKYEGLGIAVIEAQISGLKCWVSEVVPKEVDLFNNVIYLDINKEEKIWANSILESNTIRLVNSREKIENSGYEISKESLKLMNIYNNLID